MVDRIGEMHRYFSSMTMTKFMARVGEKSLTKCVVTALATHFSVSECST